MPVLFIVQEQINDPEALASYSEKARQAPSPGKLVAVDDNPVAIEGAWHGSRCIILEFEDEAAFRTWYDSPEYQEAVAIRLAATDSRSAIVHTL